MANGNFGIGDTSPSEALSVTGNITATGTVIATDLNLGTLNPNITSSDADGYLAISGDSTVVTGANIRLFGASHATNAGDFSVRNNTITALKHDSSASLWDFQANDITTTGTFTAGNIIMDGGNPGIVSSDADGYLHLSGGASGSLGAQIRLFGDLHATDANDVRFRSTSANTLIYNSSASEWHFQANKIKTTGTIETTSGIYLGGTAAANLMDDYEEGTWTPVVRDAFSAGNLATLTVGEASYTKVGNMVTVWLLLNDIDTTGMTAGNVVYVTGLPFAAATKTGVFRNCGAVETTQIAYTGYLVANVNEGESSIIMRDVRSGAGILSMKVQDVIQTYADLSTTITYETTA
jgi:hypothetical protein